MHLDIITPYSLRAVTSAGTSPETREPEGGHANHQCRRIHSLSARRHAAIIAIHTQFIAFRAR
eukprot:scaffold20741_cov99-Isochrysis_galbana.AAC.2